MGSKILSFCFRVVSAGSRIVVNDVMREKTVVMQDKETFLKPCACLSERRRGPVKSQSLQSKWASGVWLSK